MTAIESPARQATAPPIFEGRVAVVTGGSRGIGAAITHELVRAGAHVAAGYNRDAETAARLRDELTASQLLKRAQPGQAYILAGTVMDGSVSHNGDALLFRVRDPKLRVSVPVRYTGIVPDPFRAGRGVLVTVRQQGSSFVGEQDSLTTKCPSKYQATSASY